MCRSGKVSRGENREAGFLRLAKHRSSLKGRDDVEMRPTAEEQRRKTIGTQLAVREVDRGLMKKLREVPIGLRKMKSLRNGKGFTEPFTE